MQHTNAVEVVERLHARIADLEAELCMHKSATAVLQTGINALEGGVRRMHAAVPGGSICDPQSIADDLREIAKSVGVKIEN